MIMCADVRPCFFFFLLLFLVNCEELSDLFLAPEAGRCFEEAISVRGFGLISVIQVLQSQLIG